MKPFIYLWGLSIPTFGLILIVGMSFSLIFLKYQAKKAAVSYRTLCIVTIYKGLGGLLGANLVYAIRKPFSIPRDERSWFVFSKLFKS